VPNINISKILPCYVKSRIAFFILFSDHSRTDCDRRELIFVYFAAFDELEKKKKQKKKIVILSFVQQLRVALSIFSPFTKYRREIQLANGGIFDPY
jgi:hypothetical protein